ncbi:MAG: S46 family peptidase [Saprospiraceae bacterium]|nr:S46 family peptidase [Saprospiraceae bacterium]
MKKSILILCIGLFSIPMLAQGGMWIPMLLEQLNEEQMQGLGMEMSAADIYSVNQSSLKDAIVHFGGFCTSELISPNGLLLTNHHCGYGQIQSHSTIDHNYLEDGFWAADYSEELPNTGLSATFINRMEDVTRQVLTGVTKEMTARERQSAIDKNLETVKAGIQKEAHQDVAIKPFYKGNQYFAFVTTTYLDVRLVGAPPSSIGKFGADTDNWVWPRHTGDFSLFRIYAGADNMPAEYSETNVPYKPKHFLPISLDGVEPGDFTLVFGFPGSTNQYLPSSAVRQIMEIIDPVRISIRDKSLAVLDRAMRQNPETKIQYASKFARIANGWKKWIGEVQGLEASNALAKKEKYEADFSEMVSSKPAWKTEYGSLLKDMKILYKDLDPYAKAREYFLEISSRNVEGLSVAGYFKTLIDRYDNNGAAGFTAYAQRLSPYLEGMYKDFDPSVDQEIFTQLIQMYFEDVDPQYLPADLYGAYTKVGTTVPTWAGAFYSQSGITSWANVSSWLDMEPEKAVELIRKDPLIGFYMELLEAYQEKVAVHYDQINEQLDELQRKYMAAQMEVFPKRRFYPDANSTLRVTYGQVKGYSPMDAVQYEHVTYLDGVIEKYVPGDYEFDVPNRLLELYRSKDYGQYADTNGKIPVCFIGTNHTSGGNSGSPAVDANGNLIGLNFDRVWEGTMSDINYDPDICRNIMVDIRYVLFIIDKYANAKHLVDEMELVHPKK